MTSSRIKTLVLFAQYTDKLSYYDDWRDAFTSSPEFECTAVNVFTNKHRSFLKTTIGDYDLIVLLHSVVGDSLRYIKPYKDILQGRRGKLLTFVGNEVNIPGLPMKEKIAFIQDIQADFIGTQLPLEAGQWLYEDCRKSVVIALPHALNEKVYKPLKIQNDRGIDIGSRSHKYDIYLGDNDRNRLFDFFLSHKFDPPLVVDINTEKRFNRNEWAMFLNNCKGTISNEAGSYYLERDDKTTNAIMEYVIDKQQKSGVKFLNVGSNIQGIYESLPPVAREISSRVLNPIFNIFKVKHKYNVAGDISFDEIDERFFKNYPKKKIYTKAISSRHFDAVGTKTCQIMFKGKFNDILKADTHYIAIESNFSNIDDVMRRFRDNSYRQSMVDSTHEYVTAGHTYRNRLNTIMKLL